ncbi:MAG: hypothetical protein EMLJLAPB_01253 [Candidatus Argoarchaeum ethanivorans]|uniref:Uncharacterized protein n=1 Tax=Candidatus Argoarchaeum ethanivorans TaxID=2608793 RepID=A0A811TGY6_9EURY|nr:MAG: hypothetical protein EMLJLAPB_01253 [Candidatus Argoarchaeum ethanivorans]
MMLRFAEISSKTKYSDVEDLMKEAENLDPDNEALQISIDSYRRTGNPLDLKVIMDFLKWNRKLRP